MKSLIHYHFALYFRTHKYVPPLTVFIMMLIINYTFIPNPIFDSYSFTALLLFFLMGWFTVSVLHAEDEGQQRITIIHAKNKREHYLALVINCILVGLLLSLVAIAYPIVFQAFKPGLQLVHIIIGFLAHFSLAVLSISLSLFFTRVIVKSNVNSWWGVIGILVVSLAVSVAKVDILRLKLINWLLPPLRYSLEILSVSDQTLVFPKVVYVQFVWIFIYSLILIFIFLLVVQKK